MKRSFLLEDVFVEATQKLSAREKLQMAKALSVLARRLRADVKRETTRKKGGAR